MPITKVEIDFAIPVELTDAEMQLLDKIANDAARRTETDKIVHWAAGCGCKPKFSKTDCLFLGKKADEDAPESGEPTWDESVFYIETCARERYEGELRRPAPPAKEE